MIAADTGGLTTADRGGPTATTVQKSGLSRFYALRTQQATMFGLVILLLLVLVAIFAPVLAPQNPFRVSGAILQPPSGDHWLGTDQVGRDVFSRLIHGSRTALLVGVIVGFGSLLVGGIVGAVAGYFGGWIDTALSRIIEVFQVFPSLALALMIVAVFGPSFVYVCAALIAAVWPQTARIVRGKVRLIRRSDMVAAARAVGYSDMRILRSDVLPNASPPLIVQTAIDIGHAILLQAGLAFLGLGDPNQISWGTMLENARADLTAWWLSIPPGALIFLLVLALNLVADGLNHVLGQEPGQL